MIFVGCCVVVASLEDINHENEIALINICKEEETTLRQSLAHKLHRPLSSSFEKLLTGRDMLLQNLSSGNLAVRRSTCMA